MKKSTNIFFLEFGLTQNMCYILFLDKNKLCLLFYHLNPLLHRLYLDHDIIFYFRQHLKYSRKLKLSLEFENIMENGAFAPKEQMLHFP